MTSTGNRIEVRRNALGLSRAELAERLKTHPRYRKASRMTVWRVENGRVKLPTDDLGLWAAALETSSTDLVG